MYLYYLLIFSYAFVLANNDHDLKVSPCPRIFVYETYSPEPDRWYGIITLVSNLELTGVWLKITFNKPILQLGNWFGEVIKETPTEYLIRDISYYLKAFTPKVIRIFVKYNVNKDSPLLLEFQLNAKIICPENIQTTTPSSTTEHLFTSKNENLQIKETVTKKSSMIQPLIDALSRPIEKPPYISEHKQTISDVCGTVMAHRLEENQTNQVASVGEYPWHATLYYTKDITIAYLCAASLISKKHLLTVAHCVIKSHSQVPVKPERLIVYLGKHYLKHWSSEGTQTRYLSNIVPHPDYNFETYNNDIAVLKLSIPVDFTDVIRPVCLWDGPSDIDLVKNRSGNVIGWGFDSTGKIEERLMHVEMLIQENEICNASIVNYTSRFSSDNTYCANFAENTIECVGDSGGGMVFLTTKNNRTVWQLRGLVAVSVVLQQQLMCDRNRYVVFTDVAKYLSWIKESILL